MKIAYIGTADDLAVTLIERMIQEGNEVYLLSDKDLPKGKNTRSHRYYHRPKKGSSFEKLLLSVAPDCVMFAGNYFGNDDAEGAEDELNLLTQSLRTAVKFPDVQFLFFSSIEVYGNTTTKANEFAPCAATTDRGVRFLHEESTVWLYKKQFGMNVTILRASQLYSDHPKEIAYDFLSDSFKQAIREDKEIVADIFQPLHVADFADAVKRVLDAGADRAQPVYNVCGSQELQASVLHQMVCATEKIPLQEVHWRRPTSILLGDSSLIRKELGWSDIRDLTKQFQTGEVHFERASVKRTRNKDRKLIPDGVRKTLENLIIFAVFFALDWACATFGVFTQVNWMMIYVVLIALSYSVYQSGFASILASVAYLLTQNFALMDLGSFYTYVDIVLAVIQFLFIGVIVSYTTNLLREEVHRLTLEHNMLQQEYDDLCEINDENVLIKNEYEERVLASKTGFPKLYDLVSRLMVQEPDRILMETMQVISELIDTNTVAVYRAQANSPWLRLMGALNEDSTMGGKTWNLSNSPQIYDAVNRGELYQGTLGSRDPAVVLPILCHGVPEAVVLIKTLPYESETLYHINLLKTMSLLLEDSMEKAMNYEELSREEHYVAGTDILKPDAFRERVKLDREMAEKGLADYSVIQILFTGSIESAARDVSGLLRTTDYLGTDGTGKLYALLNNTSLDSLKYLENRFLSAGLGLEPVQDFQSIA